MVVYIIGDNRSGSTLLDYLLASHPAIFSVGELHHLSDFYTKKRSGSGILRNWECSCGHQLQDCEFWRNVIIKSKLNQSDYTKVKIELPKLYYPAHRIFEHKIEKRLIDNKELGECFANIIWKIYKSIINQTKSPIILDSSKSGIEAYYLNKYRDGNIKFIVIEREIRAVARSKIKRSVQNAKYYNKQIYSIYRYLYGSYKNLWYNRYCSQLIQKERDTAITSITYSELARNPQSVISNLQSFLGIDKYDVPCMTNVYGEQPHILGGSPSRFIQKKIEVDNEWKNYYQERPLSLFFGKILEMLC